MRFKRLPEDKAKEKIKYMRGRAWCLPEYSAGTCTPPRLCLEISGAGHVSKPSPTEEPQTRSTSHHQRQPQVQQYRPVRHFAGRVPKNREDLLPTLASTVSKKWRTRHLSRGRQLLAALCSITVALGLLSCLLSLFSSELERLESEIETQHATVLVSDNSREGLYHNSEGKRAIHHGRKLAQENDSDETVHNTSTHGFWAGLGHEMVLLFRQKTLLLSGSRTLTASMIGMAPNLPPFGTISYRAEQPSRSRKANDEQEYLLLRLRSIYEDLLSGRIHPPARTLQSDQSVNGRIVGDSAVVKGDKNAKPVRPKEFTGRTPRQRGDIPHHFNSHGSPPTNVLYSEALSVDSLGSTNASRSGERRDARPVALPATFNLPDRLTLGRPVSTNSGTSNSQTLRGIQTKQDRRQLSPLEIRPGVKVSLGSDSRLYRTSPLPAGSAFSGKDSVPLTAAQAGPLTDYDAGKVRNAVEIWELPSGKYLCRIYNIGRLDDGSLILPTWMQKHAGALKHRCGIVDAIFAIRGSADSDSIAVDPEKAKLLLKDGIRVNKTNGDRDLFGTAAPRHHMPHFVSDIILNLVATEVILGPGKYVVPVSVLLPTSLINSPSRIRMPFPGIKPSMLLKPITMQASPSSWVQRLAKFFQKPGIGFTFIPEPEATLQTKQSTRDISNISVFRSVITTNSDMYEPYGLFDASGKSYVLAANGISREPSWQSSGMRDSPCKISVTALTRKGPRALLGLDKLKNKLQTGFRSVGLKLDFKVVDFNLIPFEEQVRTMQDTNILIATHGAGNANLIFMKPAATVIEVFPFAYKAGPFDGFAHIFGLDYKASMSVPQTEVFKGCMNRHERKDHIKRKVLEWWDKAVAAERADPWVHRLELEKEFGEPGKAEGMTTRACVRLQELEFNIETVSKLTVESARRQCMASRSHVK